MAIARTNDTVIDGINHLNRHEQIERLTSRYRSEVEHPEMLAAQTDYATESRIRKLVESDHDTDRAFRMMDEPFHEVLRNQEGRTLLIGRVREESIGVQATRIAEHLGGNHLFGIVWHTRVVVSRGNGEGYEKRRGSPAFWWHNIFVL